MDVGEAPALFTSLVRVVSGSRVGKGGQEDQEKAQEHCSRFLLESDGQDVVSPIQSRRFCWLTCVRSL